MALARTDLSAVTQIGAGASSAVVTGAGNTVFIKSIQLYNLINQELKILLCTLYLVVLQELDMDLLQMQ